MVRRKELCLSVSVIEGIFLKRMILLSRIFLEDGLQTKNILENIALKDVSANCVKVFVG